MYGEPTPPPSRPLGVAILAVLIGLYAFLLIVAGALILAGSSVFAFLGLPASFVGASGLVLGTVVLIIGLIVLGVALGLWHLRLWALVLALIVTFVELVGYALAGAFVTLGFILSLLIFIYLLAVHRHFH